MNAIIDDASGEIVYRNYVDISGILSVAFKNCAFD